MKFNRLTCKWIFLLICCVAGFALYGNVLGGSFQYDDYPVIVNNPVIETADPVELFRRVAHPTRYISYLTFAWNYALHGRNPLGFHVVNVLIHIVNAWLVALLVCGLTRTPRLVGNAQRHGEWLAFGAGMLFLVHPLQTESVSYITQRFTSLATLFYLSALLCYVTGRLAGNARQRGLYFAACLGLTGLGMLTKQIVLTLPVMILVTELLLFGRPKGRRLIAMGVAVGLAVLVIPALYQFDVSGIFSIQHESGSHRGDWITSASYQRTQPRVVLTYLRLLIWPLEQNLLYDFRLSPTWMDGRTVGALSVFALLIAFAVWRIRVNPLIAWGVCWFFVTLSVESTVIPIRHVIFEHRTYLPSVGFFTLVAVGGERLIRRQPTVGIAAALVVWMSLAVLTVQRNHLWADGVRMWTDVAAKSPAQAKPFYNLGYEYLRDNDLDQAFTNFSRAIEIDPDYFDAYNNRSQIYQSRGQTREAFQDISNAIRVNPRRAEALANRGVMLRDMRQYEYALKDFDLAVRLEPDEPAYRVNRGLVLGDLGKVEAAIQDLDHAIKSRPRFAKAYNVRASLHLSNKDLKPALEDFSAAIELDPDNASYYRNRAQARVSIAQWALALKDLTRSIELDPDHWDGFARRAYVLSRMDLPDQALEDYARVLALNPSLYQIHLERGKILYLQGKYPEAIAEFDQLLKRQPQSALGYLFRGFSHYEQRQYRAALNDIKQAEANGHQVDPVYYQRIQEALRQQ